jgi:diguanylate cyclase (GGDEF)-like protein
VANEALPRELAPIRDSFVRVTGELGSAFAALQRTLEREQGVRAKLEQVLSEREHEISQRTKELEVAVRALRDQSEHDGLTGLANYRRYRAELERLWGLCLGEHCAIGALGLDVDHFKQYNDTYGHLAGDACLRQVGATLRSELSGDADVIARSGGEEFVALFQSADRQSVMRAAERVRAAIEALQMPHSKAQNGVVTVSIGVAIVVPTEQLQADALIRGADLALYRAKRSGRNRVAEMSPALLQRAREP